MLKLQHAFVLSVVCLGACQADHESSQADEANMTAADSPSMACAAAASEAVQALETINGRGRSLQTATLIDAHSDHELIRVQVGGSDTGDDDHYLIHAESMGGSPCYVYGLQLESEAMDLQDDGSEPLQHAPSDACIEVASAAVVALEQAYGDDGGMDIVGTELVDAHSDAELIRVLVQGPDESDSYLVSTESMGGDPCYVYGLQLRSEQVDLSP